VRVIPERAGVPEREAIREGIARFDWALDHVGAIHRRRQAEPMPVDDRRLGKVIGESELENVADTRLDYRSGDLTVEAPRFGGDTGCELPVHLSSLEVDLDNRPIRVWNRCLVRLLVGGQGVARRSVDNGSMAVSMPVSMLRLSVVLIMRSARHRKCPRKSLEG
jgi:hypothetical protein